MPHHPRVPSLLFVASLLCLAVAPWVASESSARKPPRVQGEAVLAERYWSLHLRFARGRVVVLDATPRWAAEGHPARIAGESGPLRIALLDAKGRVLARHELSFPLLGPGDDESELAAGLTAETTLRLPHAEGLRAFRIEDAKMRVLGRSDARWSDDDAEEDEAPIGAEPVAEEASKVDEDEADEDEAGE